MIIVMIINLILNINLITSSLIPYRLDFNNYNKNEKYCEIDYNELRREAVKEAFLHSWLGYKKYAWGKDELKPLTNSSNERFQNWGATLVDSLTTLWLMDLKEEFNEAVKAVSKIDFTNSIGRVNFFETTIRYLGGLIGGYDLSGEKILLQQAIKLADNLMIAFDSPTGFPYNEIIFPGTIPDKTKRLVLAEIGTCQLEFVRLSQLTGDSKYERKSMAIFDKLDKLKKSTKGLYPVHLSPETGEFDTKEVSFGSLGDSFYEYLIKVYMLTGKKDARLKRMYLESIEGFKTLLHTREDGLQYFTRIGVYGFEEDIMDHLSLFMGGLLQYGDFVLNSKDNSKLGLSLTHLGFEIYNSTETKLGSEVVLIIKFDDYITHLDKTNNLRPEFVESLFYSWRFTKDTKFRDQAWEIFKSFNKYSRTESGFSVYYDVTNLNIKEQQRDTMESFWMAETLKYLYLIFCDDSKLDFNEFVLNTEAHPIRLNGYKY